MKRFLSLLIVALMLVSVFVLASCTQKETTAAQTEKETTAQVTTKETTAEVTTKETTTATPTTEAPVTETTKETPAVYTGETTTVPIFARFDFGTKSYAVEQGLTSHEYLVGALSYNSECVYIDFNDDSWTVWAMKNYNSADDTFSPDGGVTTNRNFSLAFNSMITYDFDDQLIAGYGSWQNMPYNTSYVNKTWRGYHQYMKIRLINNSLNNMMSMRFRTTKDGAYYTTCVASNMYFQGGAGKLTATAKSTEYKSYVYDLIFLSCLASDRPQNTFGTDNYAATWAGACKYIGTGAAPGNNWVWGQGLEVVALEFNVLGAFCPNYQTVCDSRTNIKAGNYVEIDYIIFGSDGLTIDEYKSNLERKA
jgi:Na+-transporting methylmalonyl-CoA/oxaloacetate decarboxylase gamma subunit